MLILILSIHNFEFLKRTFSIFIVAFMYELFEQNAFKPCTLHTLPDIKLKNVAQFAFRFRSTTPTSAFFIMNRLNMNNMMEPITNNMEFKLQDPFLLYRNNASKLKKKNNRNWGDGKVTVHYR